MRKPFVLLALNAVLSLTTTAALAQNDAARVYSRVNLVSDIAGVARFTDPNLVNAWGIAFGPTTPIWIADNGGNVSTVYDGNGRAVLVGTPPAPLVVSIPSPGSPTGGTPTGIVFNDSADFVVSSNGKSGTSRFIFATEDGTILGWSPAVDFANAVIAKDNSGSNAVYKGLAIAHTGDGNFIYAANFHEGIVEMYDGKFNLVRTCTDATVDANFAPFGIQNIEGRLIVTFALQKLPDRHDDQAGPGNGFVDVFDTSCHMVGRLASHGTLNSPWGLALAPDEFGAFSNRLLVGNFGDGRINAFRPRSGVFDGQLIDPEGNPLTINGLWGLHLGAGGGRNG